MRITLDPRKSIDQNAAMYFERAKKARKKLEGARQALEATRRKLAAAQQPTSPKGQPKRVARKREWFEKFRWFRSSEGFLCIGGRDVSTNEQVIKQHTRPGDVVFHTDMAGSPFVVVQAEGKQVGKATLDEAAQFTACYGRAWKMGLSIIEVFHVAPEQVSKTPNTGESLGRGAFVIRGQTTYHRPRLEVCIGSLPDGVVMAGPQDAVLQHCGTGFMVLQGNEKSSDVAKRIAAQLGCHPDDVIPLLPAGGVKLGQRISKADAPARE